MQELLPGPDVTGEAQGHCRGPLGVAASTIRRRQWEAERDVLAEPVLLEKTEAEEGVPGLCVLGERMRLAGQVVQAISQRSVEAFEVDGVGKRYLVADLGPDLDPL